MTKEQLITEDYAVYNSDCMEVIKDMPNESVDLSVYSPPFAALYTYSSSERDMSNVASNEEFYKQYEYLVKELSRVTKPGRINAVHCTDLFKYNGALTDFPAEIIDHYNREMAASPDDTDWFVHELYNFATEMGIAKSLELESSPYGNVLCR